MVASPSRRAGGTSRGSGSRPHGPVGHHGTSRRIAHNGVWSRLSTGVDGVVDVPVEQEATTQVSDAQHLWNAAAQILRAQVSEAVWHSTFSDARPVNLDGGVARRGRPELAREGTRAGSLRGDGARRALRGRLPGRRALHRGDSRRGGRDRRRDATRSAREPDARLAVGPVRHGAGEARPRAHAHSHGRRSEPSLHVRGVRHRHLQPVRPRRRALGGRDAGSVVQPALHLRSCRDWARPTCSTRSATT